MAAHVESAPHNSTVIWRADGRTGAEQLDLHRVTEDAAEAISLALAAVALNWVVRRRLQRNEGADWLMRSADGLLVALEISGIDRADGGRRLRQKIAQAASATVAPYRAACVVELTRPRADLAIAAPNPR